MTPRLAALPALALAACCAAAAPAADGPWTRLPPPTLTDAAMVADPVRNRLLVLCGYDGVRSVNEVWELPLAGGAAWRQLFPSGTLPAGRRGHAAVYDPVRDRVLVIGGGDGATELDDVWALALAAGETWAPLAPSGAPPGGRTGHSAVYDPVRDRVIVFGGQAGGVPLDEVWALSLTGSPAWSAITPAGPGPSARRDHAAIYDPAGDRMILFGGYDGAARNDAWSLELSAAPAWSPLAPGGSPPSERFGHTMVLDAAGGRAVMVGGIHAGPPYLNDAWALDLAGGGTWSPLAPSGTPPGGRFGHVAAYDPGGERLLVHGGYDGLDALGDAWSLALGSAPAWTLLDPPGPVPPGRSGHAAVWDPDAQRMVVYGGYRGVGLDDVWSYSAISGAWSPITPQGPSPIPRLNHSAILDPVRHRMVVFGGNTDGGAFLNDTWALSLDADPAWTPLMPPVLPPFRQGHAAIYDPLGDRMIVFGGFGGAFDELLDDCWALSLSGPPQWTQLFPSGVAPFGRVWSAAAYDSYRARMLIHGGDFGFGSYDDAWELALSGAPAWAQLFPPAQPAGRQRHAGIYDPARDRLLVFGGLAPAMSDETWALSFQGAPLWSPVIPAGGRPAPRLRHTAVYDPGRDRMLVYGGQGDAFPLTPHLNDLWALPLDAATPVLASLVSVAAEPDRVRLEWKLGGAYEEPAAVYRREAASEWSARARIAADPSGRLVYEDRDVRPGARLGYRLGLCEGGREVAAGETWVEVPAALRLGLGGAWPNPSAGELWVSFTLPDRAPAALELCDVAGRRVARRELGGLGAGSHRVRLADGASLPAGLYVVRLRQGGRALTRRACILR